MSRAVFLSDFHFQFFVMDIFCFLNWIISRQGIHVNYVILLSSYSFYACNYRFFFGLTARYTESCGSLVSWLTVTSNFYVWPAHSLKAENTSGTAEVVNAILTRNCFVFTNWNYSVAKKGRPLACLLMFCRLSCHMIELIFCTQFSTQFFQAKFCFGNLLCWSSLGVILAKNICDIKKQTFELLIIFKNLFDKTFWLYENYPIKHLKYFFKFLTYIIKI